jgi:hypothetical protein
MPKMASDCVAVVSAVVSALKDLNLGKYSQVLQEIKACTSNFSCFTLVHDNNVFNKEPHVLARLVSGSAIGRYFWFDNPTDGVCIPNIVRF